jgi:hypothetical protein
MITIPSGDLDRAIAEPTLAGSVPNPPDGLPAATATGTSLDPIWLSISANPSANFGLWDTSTIPTGDIDRSLTLTNVVRQYRIAGEREIP